MTTPDVRRRLLAIGRRLPEVAMEEGHHVAFRVRGRTFAYLLDDHHGDGVLALCCKAAPGEQEALIASDPERFLVPAYLGSRGWISMRLDVPNVDWAEAEELFTEAYRLVAPKRLVDRLEAQPGDQ